MKANNSKILKHVVVLVMALLCFSANSRIYTGVDVNNTINLILKGEYDGAYDRDWNGTVDGADLNLIINFVLGYSNVIDPTRQFFADSCLLRINDSTEIKFVKVDGGQIILSSSNGLNLYRPNGKNLGLPSDLNGHEVGDFWVSETLVSNHDMFEILKTLRSGERLTMVAPPGTSKVENIWPALSPFYEPRDEDNPYGAQNGHFVDSALYYPASFAFPYDLDLCKSRYGDNYYPNFDPFYIDEDPYPYTFKPYFVGLYIQSIREITGVNVQLPSIYQWLYLAMLCGNRNDYPDLLDSDWTRFYYPACDEQDMLTPVKTFPANKLGLYDMEGGVHEYCGPITYEKVFCNGKYLKIKKNFYYVRSHITSSTVGDRILRNISWLAQKGSHELTFIDMLTDVYGPTYDNGWMNETEWYDYYGYPNGHTDPMELNTDDNVVIGFRLVVDVDDMYYLTYGERLAQ